MEQQQLFYDDRFLKNLAGKIVTDPLIAIVELIANCWDAYSTDVYVTWPDVNQNIPFSITDNGTGMSKDDFSCIWRTLSYNRIAKYGRTTNPPAEIQGSPRSVFGQNGIGRFAAFCFSDKYTISSKKNGQEFKCLVSHTEASPLVIKEIEYKDTGVKGHGTTIESAGKIHNFSVTEEEVREQIGKRFIANPMFNVFVNETKITFNDISQSAIQNYCLDIENAGTVKIIHIDTFKADKTTKQHGIAWWVLNRAVGECKWRGSDYQRILDGRTSEAKRYTFIIQADLLNEVNAVKEDWSWFREENQTWKNVYSAVQDKIKGIIDDNYKYEKDSKRRFVTEKIGHSANKLSLAGKDMIRRFIDEIVENCPNFGEQEILQLSQILVKLEKTNSRYGLLDILHDLSAQDIDKLHELLQDWTVSMAKIVLDEIQNRLKLIEELEQKIRVERIDEVHELQPLFEKGLWMFGPQFESIEFTSNKGMTTVIQKIFKDKKGKGTRNRPDFVIIPDVAFYARPSYDDDYNENGTEHLVIVDLKTTSLSLGSEEKDQIWKYVKELRQQGHIKPSTKVDGFVLGDKIEPGEEEPELHGDNVKISTLLYDTILTRAKKRLFNLHSQVKNAPFLMEGQETIKQFIEPIPVKQGDIVQANERKTQRKIHRQGAGSPA